MSMLEWTKREIEIACKRERNDKDTNKWDYVLYVIKPDGERVEINRYFDDTDDPREITK